jgi:hypothetical protein
MYLQDGTRTHFMAFLQREFPRLLPKFERLYTKKYPPESYRKEVKAMVSILQQRYGMDRRGLVDEDGEEEERAEPEQIGFRW